MGLTVYFAFLVLAIATLPAQFLDYESERFILIIGVIGAWRYGWAVNHFVRSLVYRRFVYPRMRLRAEALGDDALPEHVYLLVTTFKISTDTTARVYRAAIEEGIRSGIPTTVVASLVDRADEQLVRSLYRLLSPPEHMSLVIVRRPGTGKRDALASGFNAIARLDPPASAVVAVIDGDSMLSPGLIRRCTPFFAANPRIGALTTDEICEISGEGWVADLYRTWYEMRFAQRHILMSSMGLSGRVLTLTGRMSMFRASIITDPSFVATVQYDYIDHWRLGRFRFLTGDDKSSWYYLLKSGWEMPYIPDVTILTVEHPPHPNFLAGATMLMIRWFGNMLRTNARAIAIPRSRIGTFVWWCLVDQRVSMWTSLIGLVAAVMGSILYGIEMLWLYAVWIMLTRFVLTVGLTSARPNVSGLWPLLLYFNQIYGSFIKIYMLSHLNRQKWTRQKTSFASVQLGFSAAVQRFFSNVTLAASFGALFLVMALMTGLFGWGDLRILARALIGG
jgi:glycosyltransferase Alg8